MKKVHKRTQWTCPCLFRFHPEPPNFGSEDEFTKHLLKHSEFFTAADIPRLVSCYKDEVDRRWDAEVLPSCPMCGISVESVESDVDELCRHIAQELFDYALLAIPDQSAGPTRRE